MKKLLLTAMIAALLIVPLEGMALAETPEASQPDTSVYTTEALEPMAPAIHGMVLSMLHYGLTAFDTADPALGWESLYNMLSLYGQMDERSDYIGDDLVLPVEAAMDFASALFPGFHALGQMPGELADRMVYDAGLDSYRLTCGSDDLAEIQLESSRETESGLEISGALVYLVDGSDLAQFQATLRPSDNMFGYTIVGLELL